MFLIIESGAAIGSEADKTQATKFPVLSLEVKPCTLRTTYTSACACHLHSAQCSQQIMPLLKSCSTTKPTTTDSHCRLTTNENQPLVREFGALDSTRSIPRAGRHRVAHTSGTAEPSADYQMHQEL
jgi:hypothetical protein